VRFLRTPTRGADPSCQILLVERLAYECLDHHLAADIQLLGGAVQFFQHARRQVNIHPLDRTHHLPGIREEPGHICALVGKVGDGFCRQWLARLRVFFIKFVLLRGIYPSAGRDSMGVKRFLALLRTRCLFSGSSLIARSCAHRTEIAGV
jgi:hypothetical protein